MPPPNQSHEGGYLVQFTARRWGICTADLLWANCWPTPKNTFVVSSHSSLPGQWLSAGLINRRARVFNGVAGYLTSRRCTDVISSLTQGTILHMFSFWGIFQRRLRKSFCTISRRFVCLYISSLQIKNHTHKIAPKVLEIWGNFQTQWRALGKKKAAAWKTPGKKGPRSVQKC